MTQGALPLARAADLAGVGWPQMRDILREQGIIPVLGPETLAEAEEEVAALRDEPVAGHERHRLPRAITPVR